MELEFHRNGCSGNYPTVLEEADHQGESVRVVEVCTDPECRIRVHHSWKIRTNEMSPAGESKKLIEKRISITNRKRWRWK